MIRHGWVSKLKDYFTARDPKPLCTKIYTTKKSLVRSFSPRNLQKEKLKMYSIELFLRQNMRNNQVLSQLLISTESAKKLMPLRSLNLLRDTNNSKIKPLTNGSNTKSLQKLVDKKSKKLSLSTRKLKSMKLERQGINFLKKKLHLSWNDDNHLTPKHI